MWCPEKQNMADNFPTLFNKSLPELRLLGQRGGRRYGRNQRIRRALMPPVVPSVPVRRVPGQTTAQAIALLDAQFPWLSGTENQSSRKPPARRPLDCTEPFRAGQPPSGAF
jgi:hypothetical protein